MTKLRGSLISYQGTSTIHVLLFQKYYSQHIFTYNSTYDINELRLTFLQYNEEYI